MFMGLINKAGSTSCETSKGVDTLKLNTMKNKNPFMPGDRVVCLSDDWILQDGPGAKCNLPKKGEVLSVDYVWNEKVGFDNHNTGGEYNWFAYWYFAPVQDATEMEFEETEYAHYEEMTA